MSIKLTTEEFIKKSKEKLGYILDYSKTHYINSKTPLILICPTHGEFKQTPHSHFHSNIACRKCSYGILSSAQYIERAKNVHGDKFEYNSTIYKSSRKTIDVICKKHGCFLTMPETHIITKNGGCSGCSTRLTTQEFIDRCNIIHNFEYDYSLVDYQGDSEKVKIICKIHGVFEQVACAHYKHGCSACSKKRKITKEVFIELANKIHNNKYDYSQVECLGAFVKVKILCPNHGPFWQDINTHLNSKCGCSKCTHRNSKNELLWLDSLYIPNDKEHRDVCIKVGKKRYYVDGLDPYNKICYEYNGDYFHGNPNIYNQSDYNNVVHKTFGELYERTLKKKSDLESAGYTIISIWESEFKKQLINIEQNNIDEKEILKKNMSRLMD